MKTLILGDVHGQFKLLNKLVHQRLPDRNVEYDRVLLVGDIGIGFGAGRHELPPFFSEKELYFIRGNHDNPEAIMDLSRAWKSGNWNYIPDGHIENGVLYIGGAWSIDANYRTPGLDWWFNEQLNHEQMDEIEQAILEYDDEIHTVITHDCPHSLYEHMGVIEPRASKTSWFLEHLREHILIGPKRPTQWYFGHHHKRFNATIERTRFRCLASIDRGMDYEVIDI